MNTSINSNNISGLGIHLRMPGVNTNVLDLGNQSLGSQEILLSLCGQDSISKYIVGGIIRRENGKKYRRMAANKDLVSSIAQITPKSFGLAVVSAPLTGRVTSTFDMQQGVYPLPDFKALAKRNVRIRQQSGTNGMDLELPDQEQSVEERELEIEKEELSLRKAEMKRIRELDDDLETSRYESTYLAQAYRTLVVGGVVVWIVHRMLLDRKTLDRFHHHFYDTRIFSLENDDRLVFIGKRRQTVEIGVAEEPRSWQIYRFGLEKEPLPLIGSTDDEFVVPPIDKDAVKLFRIGVVDEDEIYAVAQESRILHHVLNQQLDALSFDTIAPAPLQKGHLVQLLTSGVIDSYIGEGEQQHLVKGQSIKMLSRSQKTEKDDTINTETDFYTVGLKILMPNGEFYTIN